MSKEKHGLLGTTIKVIMVIVFTLIGAAILTLGILGLTKWKSEFGGQTWIPAVNTAFGACLITSPFFLSKNRGGLNKIIKILMAIVFVIIGALFITSGALGLTIYKENFKDYPWYPIVNIVFGCLLFTAPFYLKKSVMGSEE